MRAKKGGGRSLNHLTRRSDCFFSFLRLSFDGRVFLPRRTLRLVSCCHVIGDELNTSRRAPRPAERRFLRRQAARRSLFRLAFASCRCSFVVSDGDESTSRSLRAILVGRSTLRCLVARISSFCSSALSARRRASKQRARKPTLIVASVARA